MLLMTLAKSLGETMLKAFDVRWLEHDETVITYSSEFQEQDWLMKADILKDAIGILTEEYDSVLQKHREKNYATE